MNLVPLLSKIPSHSKSQVEIVGFEKCAKQHGNNSADGAKMICAGGNRKGACFVSVNNFWTVTLLCQGDSGGPLTKDGILIGVVSGGDATGSSCNANVSINDGYWKNICNCHF